MHLSHPAVSFIRDLSRRRGSEVVLVRMDLIDGRPCLRWARRRRAHDRVYHREGVTMVVEDGLDRLLHAYCLSLRQGEDGVRFVLRPV